MIIKGSLPSVILAFLLAPNADATAATSLPEVLDQEYVEDYDHPRYEHVTSYAPTNEHQEFAQSFTVGIDGVLSRIEVYGSGSWNVEQRLDIYDLQDSNLNQIIGSHSIVSGIGGSSRWRSIDISSLNILVEAGDELAIAFYGWFHWRSSLWKDPLLTYDDGQIFYRSELGNWQWNPMAEDFTENDLEFRTFVIPVPEPPPHIMLVVAFVAPALLRRRAAAPPQPFTL